MADEVVLHVVASTAAERKPAYQATTQLQMGRGEFWTDRPAHSSGKVADVLPSQSRPKHVKAL